LRGHSVSFAPWYGRRLFVFLFIFGYAVRISEGCQPTGDRLPWGFVSLVTPGLLRTFPLFLPVFLFVFFGRRLFTPVTFCVRTPCYRPKGFSSGLFPDSLLFTFYCTRLALLDKGTPCLKDWLTLSLGIFVSFCTTARSCHVGAVSSCVQLLCEEGGLFCTFVMESSVVWYKTGS